MESIQKAFDILTTSLTTNADSRQAFQLIPTLYSERFHTLVHSYRRPTLARSVSDPSIKTINKSDGTLTETSTRHNAVSSPLRRFATMPPPSITGCTPLTPGPDAYATNSLRRTFNPISATNLFPDETPDTDRAGSSTEPAYFSDIDEDDPSPHNDEPPSMDDDVPTMRVVTNTGGVDTGDTAPTPRTDITTGDTNNPTGTHGVMPTGPNDDTHVTNSDITIGDTNNPNNTHGVMPTGPGTIDANITDTTELHQDAATSPSPTITAPPTAEHISSFLLHIRQQATDTAGDPALSATTPADTADDTSRRHTNDPDDNTPVINVDISGDTHVVDSHTTASPTFGDNDTHVVNSDTATSPTLKRKRKYSPAQIAQRQRRRDDRRSLSAADLAPDGGSTQAGGSGGSRV